MPKQDSKPAKAKKPTPKSKPPLGAQEAMEAFQTLPLWGYFEQCRIWVELFYDDTIRKTTANQGGIRSYTYGRRYRVCLVTYKPDLSEVEKITSGKMCSCGDETGTDLRAICWAAMERVGIAKPGLAFSSDPKERELWQALQIFCP